MSYTSSSRQGQRQQLMLQLQWQQLLLLLLLLVLSWCSVAGNSIDIRSAQQLRSGTHKLCGQALNKAMDQVCENGFNAMQKRQSDGFEADVGTEHLKADQTEARYELSPILSSIYGTEVLIKTRRLRRQMTSGIHDECCVHSCTYSELEAYCLSI